MFQKKQIVVTIIALSAALAAQAGGSFAMLDVDSSGTLSKKEAAAMPGLSDKWDQLDVDADGQLSLEEYSRFRSGKEEMMQKGMEKKDRLSDTK